MKRGFKILVLLLLFCSGVYSQKFEMGKVSVKELEEKACPSDTSEVAAVLYNKAKSSFLFSQKDGFLQVYEFEVRIKIYKKDGLNLANYEVPYYVGYEGTYQDHIKLSDAVTYNLVNGKIEKTKLNGEGTFKEKVNKNWKTLSFTLPNVKVGSVIEYKYTLTSSNITSLPTFYFQRDIPVNYAEYNTVLPEYYVYKSVLKGYVDVKTDSKPETIQQGYSDSNQNFGNIGYQAVNTTHIATNIPALKREAFVDNIENYLSAIAYELNIIRSPDKDEETLSNTWESVTKSIYKDDNFGKQLQAKSYFEKDLAGVIKGIESPEAKMKAIFNYVKVKMNWNNKYGIYTSDEGVTAAYVNRAGNVAEINFILISMLNSAGILANPVLVSTIKNGVSFFPSRTAFNYVVVAVELDGKRILLDAAGQYTTPGVLPEYTLNWSGRLIRESGDSEEISMAPTVNSKRTVNIIAAIDKEGKVSGSARLIRTDYEAMDFRDKYLNMNRESYLEKLENNYRGIEIKNYRIENETKLDNPVQENFDFTSNNEVEIIGDKMYVNPRLFFGEVKNPLVQEERKLPLFFGYPSQDKISVTIDVPEGYTVETLPQSISILTGEGVGSFKYTSLAKDNKIQVTMNFDINKMIVSADFYTVIKDFFKKTVDKQNEKIILKKI